MANINTGDNGHADGHFMGGSIEPVPGLTRQFVPAKITYFGNGKGYLRAGCCGSILWNEDQDVVFMFQSANNNFPYSTPLDELSDLGYTLSQIGTDE